VLNPISVNIDFAAVFCRSGGFQTRPYIGLCHSDRSRRTFVRLTLTQTLRTGGFQTRPYALLPVIAGSG
jgi:hypothetical protein